MTGDELPIERGFPIERVNEIAQKESRAKMHYRPIYTMHKWWARRLGCVFRAICLYSLLDDPEKITVYEPGSETEEPSEEYDLAEMLGAVSLANSESLWELYTKDVRVEDKKILDPFMGGGTSLVEASRFGVESVGYDLNPVAWFVTKKQLEAGQVDVEELENAFEQIENDVANEIKQYYRTPCPNCETQDGKSIDTDNPLGLESDFDYDLPEDLRENLNEHDHYADVMYNFWVKELDCVDCGITVPLFQDYRIAKGRFNSDDQYNVFCPSCESVVFVDDWQSESICSKCDYTWTPKQGTVSGSKYACPDCGAQYAITNAIQEQGGFDLCLYAVEYYCESCDDAGLARGKVKGYKSAETFDKALHEVAEQEWEAREYLHEYVPNEEIPEGAITASSSVSGNDVFEHGYELWSDMYISRQLLCLSKLLRSIDNTQSEDAKEYLLLTFSEALNYNTAFNSYNPAYNKNTNLFNSNSFDPPQEPIENNIWGTKYGTGTFQKMWDMTIKGVSYASRPTERYISDGETTETPAFVKAIDENSKAYQGDMRAIDAENEYDAVFTDPPYYDNIIYSEVADYFYVWQKILLEDKYECFQQSKTPRVDSIVTNPFLHKTEEDFESELHESFTVVHRALKDDDGVLAFTYHHSDSESWGELLAALCDVGFEVTATYPLTADVNKFIKGEAVEFDILIIARPSDELESISWPNLRQRIYETARETRQRLEENRDLSRGDIGVIEMGECFHEYSKHHGNVHREGDIMSAKEVVDEIYGIIQEASEIGATEVFIDLLREDATDFDAVNKLCRGASTRPEELKDLRLFNTDDGFKLGTWDNEERIAYLEDALQEGDLSDLGKLQYLRYRYDREIPIGRYVRQWIDADIRELAAKLAAATGDERYEELLEIRSDDGPESAPDGGDLPLESNREQSSIDDFS
jgi:adenine-specific DNA methylase